MENTKNVAVENVEVAVAETKGAKMKAMAAAAGNKAKEAATSKLGCFIGGVVTGVAGTLGAQKVASMNADSKALRALQAAELTTTAPARGTRRADY